MSLKIDLSGKVAIVTGSSQGIGFGVAKVLAEAGCHVAGCARANADSEHPQNFIKGVEAHGVEAFYKQVDVTSLDQLTSFVEATVEKFGRIDLVVSNAGVNVFRGLSECNEADWDFNLSLNLNSHWRLAKLTRPWLEKSDNGTFLVMTSNHGFSTIPGCSPYSITKTALTGLVKSMAIEWGPQVRTVGIAPGFIDTPGNDTWFDSFNDGGVERQRTIDMHPAGKLGTPEEIGGFCAFLASDYAKFITGCTYLMDGGRSALMQDS